MCAIYLLCIIILVNNIRVRNFHRFGWDEIFLTMKNLQITIVGIITDKMHPYIVLHRNSLENIVRCTLSVSITTTLVCVLLDSTIPTYFFNILVAFLYNYHNSV